MLQWGHSQLHQPDITFVSFAETVKSYYCDYVMNTCRSFIMCGVGPKSNGTLLLAPLSRQFEKRTQCIKLTHKRVFWNREKFNFMPLPLHEVRRIIQIKQPNCIKDDYINKQAWKT